MSTNEQNNNEQYNHRNEQLADLSLNDEQAEQAKGGKLANVWGGSGSEAYQQTQQRKDS